MNMIFTLTLRNLLSNKKRTLLTLLTILLSISMITSILCGGWSLVDFLKEKEKVYGGDYDYYMENLTWQQTQKLISQNNVDEVSLLRFAGNSFYGEKTNSTMLSIGEIDENFIERFSLNQYLLAGRFPQDENEIVISESFLKKNNMNIEIGDTLSLTLGSRIWDEYNAQLSGLTNYRGEEESFVPTKEKAYVVVGILSDVNDSKIAANYNAFAGVDKTASDFAAYVKAKNLSNSIYAEAEEVAAAVDSHVAKFHSELLVYHGITGGKGAAKVIALVVMVMCLLMAASASMISNALSISLQERIKQMGMLSSIGATKGQKRLSVYLEAFLLGVVSIPLGLVVGILLSALLLSVVRAAFGETFTFGIVELFLKFLHLLRSQRTKVILCQPYHQKITGINVLHIPVFGVNRTVQRQTIDFAGFIQNNGHFILKWIGDFNIAADHGLQIFQLRANTDFLRIGIGLYQQHIHCPGLCQFMFSNGLEIHTGEIAGIQNIVLIVPRLRHHAFRIFL